MARKAKKSVPEPSPKAVRTPGSYRVGGGDSSGAATPAKSPLNKTKKRGRPIAKKAVRKARELVQERSKYTEADMLEAVRLVRVEGYAKKTAALALNAAKAKKVPVQTLRDRLDREDPSLLPQLGRPQEWD
jgi:hypothetical protein